MHPPTSLGIKRHFHSQRQKRLLIRQISAITPRVPLHEDCIKRWFTGRSYPSPRNVLRSLFDHPNEGRTTSYVFRFSPYGSGYRTKKFPFLGIFRFQCSNHLKGKKPKPMEKLSGKKPEPMVKIQNSFVLRNFCYCCFRSLLTLTIQHIYFLFASLFFG